MIYPSEFPKKENYSRAEEKIFKELSKLPDEDFTTFYNQEFTSIHPREKNEYEIDFIVVDHRNNRLNALLVIEAKGGNIRYDGKAKIWYQNDDIINPGPNAQASSAMHNLVKRFRFISNCIPFHWVLWFPDTVIRENEWLPTNISASRLLDSYALLDCKEVLSSTFDNLIKESNHIGTSLSDFEKLKKTLLRSVGFFKPLDKELAENENTFKELTQKQAKIYKYIDNNQNICVQGPAGSGKTFIAYNKAVLYAEQGLKVLFICFNKTLAKHLKTLSYNKRNSEDFPEINSFHFWALRRAEKNPKFNKSKRDDEYFNTYIPNKAKEMISEPEYDVIIIDEGQDFRENWLDLLNKTLKKEGRFLFFMDENQDIFNAFKGVPHHRNITKCALDENCRNTKLIISKLKEVLPGVKMIPMDETPDGKPVNYIKVNTNDDQIKTLNNQILK